MTVSITGLTFEKISDGATPNEHFAIFTGYGTYTAADFEITAEDGLGFTPKKVRVINLTDRNSMEHWVNSGLGTSNAEGLKDVAAGTQTYATSGITVGTRSVTIDVSAAGPITDNDDFVIECYG